MAKGNTCPNCGETKFHKEKGIMKCSQCGAIGWDTTPNSAGPGKGEKCKLCTNNTVRTMYTDDKKTIKFCSTCKSTFIM
ncbi:MAG: hypothetical protein HGA87_04585 [Desulfobulbaceae bacterium]|jgi:hypothetical protein|nr:hypothetical protein [Desulfobulbaceae bacterium]